MSKVGNLTHLAFNLIKYIMITFLTWIIYLMMIILTVILIITHFYLYFSAKSIADNKIHVDTERLGVSTAYITFMWFVVFVLENPLNL